MAVVNVWFPFDKRRILWTACMILLVVESSALSTSMLIEGKVVLNEDAFIRCDYTIKPPERITVVQISPGGSDLSYNDSYFVLNDKLNVQRGSHYHSRLTLAYYKSGVRGTPLVKMIVKMKISKLQCPDAGIYQCVFYFSPSNSTRLSKRLIVTVPPRHPTIQVYNRRKMTFLGEITYLPEGQLNVTCEVNLGTPGRGGIDWIVYHHCVRQHINPYDPRLQPMKTVPLLPGEVTCSERVSQTFLMRVTSKDDNLMISCSAHSYDFPNNWFAETCPRPSFKLCAKTHKLFFLTDRVFRAAWANNYFLKDMVQFQESVAENVVPFKWSHIFFPLALGLLIGLVVDIAYNTSKKYWKPATQAQTEQEKALSE